MTSELLHASFRDPSGFVFKRDGLVYRQINHTYSEHYLRLMQSGLYDRLVADGLLLPHAEVTIAPAEAEACFRVIQPRQLPFVSYPYEWSFGMLKDAALATLAIHKRALLAGLALKDASAYNMQLVDGRPTLIDTLSFETYIEGEPWVAYRQFCQHFLAPLALMAYTDIRLGQLLRVYIDGVPLSLAARLLPARARLNMGLLVHIFLHAGLQQSYAGRAPRQAARAHPVAKQAQMALIEGLERTVAGLQWKPANTEWANYYSQTNYTEASFQKKREVVAGWIERIQPRSAWDLGANDGTFSRLASEKGIFTVAFDLDPAAVEQNYRRVRADHEPSLLPLMLDLSNPSPGIGWHNRERDALLDRGPADVGLALALVHHLAISNNVPLPQVAEFLADAARWLIVEFIPKADSQVQRLLSSRKDIFDHYSTEGFESAFERCFSVHESVPLPDSERRLYLMERR